MRHAQIKKLISSPKAMMDFHLTGKLPALPADPSSPLITLLKTFHPSERLRITHLVIDTRLGYQGRFTFANAAQALNWLCPANRPHSLPSEAAQDKRFNKVLGIEDLLSHATIPEGIVTAWCRRMGKRPPESTPTP